MVARPRLAVAAVAAAVAAGLLLGGCGSSEPETPAESSPPASQAPSASPTPSATPTQDTGTTIDVTIRGDEISPNAEKVRVAVGEEITLRIDSDRAGEFHVHSTPDQEIGFGSGTQTATLSFDRPGLVDVEEHESHKLLVQFEVR